MGEGRLDREKGTAWSRFDMDRAEAEAAIGSAS